MEIRHLTYFKTLAEELHFGKAAEKLFISQPPLSRQIKDLEEELGVLLFKRNNKQVKLTDAGQYFLKQVDNILQELEHSKTITQQIHNNVSGTFKLGYISSTPKKLLANVLKKIQYDFPYLHVNLFETSSQRQKIALENGKLDLGILRQPIFSKQLKTLSLNKETLCIVAAKGFDFSTEKIAAANYICFNHDYAPEYYQTLVNTCHKLGFEPTIVHQSNSMHSILELVSNNLGLAVAPISVVKAMPHLPIAYMELSRKIAQTETVISYNKKSQNLAIEKFIQYLQQEARETFQ
ncbi:MAG: LysR family transcriptional regulator [Pseudopedobacter saltans]|uniref:LysR family transcriptional regulator n=1 Tax=Pseudopedobacter saltans TaxID=151895 RepID=A0A2W5GVD2_9SPHI|nr:MAG: LysR family transcriptional regulator [Pseudopedobacter saltans]